MEWTKDQYNKQYEKWVPWLEDMYLHYFTKDNKASYTAKANLDKTKVTGVKQIDTLQDGLNGVLAGQVGQGGLAQPIGDHTSKEGFTRAERQGRDDKGGYLPESAGTLATGGNAVVDGVSTGGQKVVGGLAGAGGLLGGLGGQEERK